MKVLLSKIKLTPVLITAGIAEIFLLWGMVYFFFLDNKGGMALGGLISFLAFWGIMAASLVEQWIISKLTIKTAFIWMIESLFLAAVSFYFYKTGISVG